MVNTEYHLLMTIGIARNYFQEGYNTYIYIVSPIDGSRLNKLDLSRSKYFYKKIVYNYTHPNNKLKSQLDDIINIQPESFFFFLENKYWMNYLFKKLHKNGTKIILGPDGMKTYSNYHTTYISRIKQFVVGICYSIQTHIYCTLPFVEKQYATSKYIDEVWVEYMSAYMNNTRKKVFEFHISHDNEFVNDLNKVFHTCEKDFIPLRGKTILFLDSPFSSNIYYNHTIEILLGFKSRFPDRQILIKLHQLSSEVAKKEFERLSDISYLESKYPAELFMANAEDCIVVSLISSSLLFFNPNCKYYWTFPIYKDMVDYSNILNPTNHIKIISNISEV